MRGYYGLRQRLDGVLYQRRYLFRYANGVGVRAWRSFIPFYAEDNQLKRKLGFRRVFLLNLPLFSQTTPSERAVFGGFEKI